MLLLKISMVIALALAFRALYAGATIVVDNYGIFGALFAIAVIYGASLIIERQ